MQLESCLGCNRDSTSYLAKYSIYSKCEVNGVLVSEFRDPGADCKNNFRARNEAVCTRSTRQRAWETEPGTPNFRANEEETAESRQRDLVNQRGKGKGKLGVSTRLIQLGGLIGNSELPTVSPES